MRLQIIDIKKHQEMKQTKYTLNSFAKAFEPMIILNWQIKSFDFYFYDNLNNQSDQLILPKENTAFQIYDTQISKNWVQQITKSKKLVPEK